MRNDYIKADSITEEQLSPLLRRKISGSSERITKVVENLQTTTVNADSSGQGVSVHAVFEYKITTNGTVPIGDVDSEIGRKYLLTAQQPASDNGVWICKSGDWERSKDVLYNGMVISVQYDRSLWMLAEPIAGSIVNGESLLFDKLLPSKPCVTVNMVRAMINKHFCKPDINAVVWQGELCQANWLCVQNSDEVIQWQAITVNSKYIQHTNGVLTPRLTGWYHVAAKFYDENTNPTTLQQLKIKGNGNLNSMIDMSERDRYTGTAVSLWGERLVYCNGTDDTIKVCIRHNGAGANTYRSLIGGFHNSYCIVTYQGADDAGYLGD